MRLRELVHASVVFSGEPVAELDCDGEGLLGPQERRVGNRAHRLKPLFQVPPEEAGNYLSVVGRGGAFERGGCPRLEPGQSLVTRRKCAVFDEQTAHVVGGPTGRQAVKDLVGEGLMAGEVTQDGLNVRLADPGQSAVRAPHGGQRVDDDLQRRCNGCPFSNDLSQIIRQKPLLNRVATD